MIFIDVTQSCRSSNNSGIQVVTRNLFREINAQKAVTPLIWDNFLKNYSHLNKRELKNLSDPFDKDYQAKERPNKQENPFYKEFLKSFFRLKRIKKFDNQSSTQQLFIFPEVFRDNRVFELPKVKMNKLTKGAIFHDANVLQNSLPTPAARLKNFKGYMNFLASCDAISTVSDFSKKQFIENIGSSFEQTKIVTHRLPVEPPEFQPRKKLLHVPLIIFVSTLGYNKNHLCLLDAAEILWSEGLSFELQFIGQSDPSWSYKVINKINEFRHRNRPIKWLKHIGQNELEEKYLSCSFTVFPSTSEGFGLPIIESLVRGKACICGKNGALGEIIRDGGCLTIADQKDSNQLANGIRKLLTDKKLILKLEKQAKKRDFGSWKSYSSHLLNHFLP